MTDSQIWETIIVTSSPSSAELFVADSETLEHVVAVPEGSQPHMPTIDRVVSLMPGFVYVFNHVTYSNDYTNRSVGEHLGYSSEEISAFGAEMMMRIVHPDDHLRLGEHMADIAELEGDSSISFEYRVITKDGQLRWLRSVDAVFDRSSKGQVLRHIGCATDVTVEKEAELRLARLNMQLEAKVDERTRDLAILNGALEERITERTCELQDAVDELEQLTFIATHDLKVPVNNLCRLGLMLNESKHLLAPDQAEQVGWINDCANQLGAKIQGLVLVAQIRLSSALPTERLNLRNAIEQVVQDFDNTMGNGSLPVIVNVAADLTVEFARFELNSILASLMDNAIKYADASRPLQVSFCAVEEGSEVQLTVSDNGTGLDGVKDSEKVFGLFQRAHKIPAGSGISLYCSRRMLASRGGDMTVDGTRGIGAIFNVKFPKQEAVKRDG